MSQHPSQRKLEQRFRAMLDELDEYLENRYESLYRLHPNRLPRGEASSGLYDGLFAASMTFTAGYGSQHGRGYVVVIDVSTLDRVDPQHKKEIQRDAAGKLEELLPAYFPDRRLSVKKDGNVYKIVGDFSLG